MHLLVIFIAVWLAMPASYYPSDTASISGRVIDGNGPIIQANVALRGTSRGDITDENGRFEIGQLRSGVYTIIVSVVGYKRLEREVRVIEGQNVTLELHLEKTTYDLDQVVITGTMTENTAANSPVKVEVVSPKLFGMNPTDNITEALQSVNGIYNQVDCAVCGTNNLRVNGMEGPYTAVLIDGNPIMGSSTYGPLTPDLHQLTLWM